MDGQRPGARPGSALLRAAALVAEACGDFLLGPLRLPARDWRITFPDVNRGWAPEALAGPGFTGAAAAAPTAV